MLDISDGSDGLDAPLFTFLSFRDIDGNVLTAVQFDGSNWEPLIAMAASVVGSPVVQVDGVFTCPDCTGLAVAGDYFARMPDDSFRIISADNLSATYTAV